ARGKSNSTFRTCNSCGALAHLIKVERLRRECPMTPERWRQIEKLYRSAPDLAGHEGSAFLNDACQGDGELRRRLELLLAQDSSDNAIIDRPATEALGDLDEAPLGPGARLGPYVIEGILGSGGMGRVYLAYDSRLRRLVALKKSLGRFGERLE